MLDRALINPDLNLLNTIVKAGGEDLKKCYQCSNCTVACPLTPDGIPFPRKEMIRAQWGLKEELINDVDIWLCHHCNDCSEQCPRDAKPGDVINALREITIAHFSKPSFIVSASKSLGGIAFLFLIPMIIIAAVIYFANVDSGFDFLNQETIVYANMLSVPLVDMIFLPAACFAAFTAFFGIKNFIAGLKKGYPPTEQGTTLWSAIRETVLEVMTHKKFKECGVNQNRNYAHLMLMYGFIGLFITTNLVLLIHYLHEFGFQLQETPLPFFHPVKLLGNISALLAFAGIVMLTVNRITESTGSGATMFDWVFIDVMFLTILTGILSQVVRVSDLKLAAFIVYYFHLVFIFFLLAYAPHTKFGHIFYRVVALIYSRYSGRDKSLNSQLS
jgi:quinone-modifying oxidoreductase subunit QmoC